MKSVLEAMQPKLAQVTTLFGYPADVSDPDAPAFEYRGRSYAVTGYREYVAKSGLDTMVITLAAACEHCGETFEYETGWNKLNLYANCPDHRLKRGDHAFGHLAKRLQPTKSEPGKMTADERAADWARTLANAKLDIR